MEWAPALSGPDPRLFFEPTVSRRPSSTRKRTYKPLPRARK
ncbi:hypothetical protein [Lysobacter gummosus]